MLNPWFAFHDAEVIIDAMYGDNDLDRNDLDEYIVQFRTDKDALRACVPEAYDLDEDPVVTCTFIYVCNAGVAARGECYISAVCAAVKFDGEEKLSGDYVLVMPENKNYNVLTGRDFYGAAKIVSDVLEPATTVDGVRCQVNGLGGEFFYSAAFGPMEEADDETRKNLEALLNERPLFQYKNIMDPWTGEAEVCYPVCCPAERRIDKLWVGKEATFTAAKDMAKGWLVERQCAIVLNTLPVKEVLGTYHIQGNLRFLGDEFRKLQ